MLSLEQTTAVELARSNNIIIDSVAGSGKTTVLLEICKNDDPKSRNLILTYNKALQTDTNDKIHALKLRNCVAQTMHAFAETTYGISCRTDDGIKTILKEDKAPKKQLRYTRIIVDEVQDQRPHLFQIICKIIRDSSTKPLICFVGDVKQCIYQYDGSDPRFLTFGQDLLQKANNFPWAEVKLTRSFRITDPMAQFICRAFKTNFIKSVKRSSSNPVYYIVDGYCTNEICDEITKLKTENNLENKDIFILSKKIREKENRDKTEENKSKVDYKSPICCLENKLKDLKEFQINVTSEDEKVASGDTNEKLIISSFHKSKGLERELVVVYNFDSSYFKYFASDQDPHVNKPPNDVYVAMTRAKEHLLMIHDFRNDMFEFLTPDIITESCDVVYLPDCETVLRKRFKTFDCFVNNIKFNNGIKYDDDDYFDEKVRRYLLQFGDKMNREILKRFQENKMLTSFNYFGCSFEKFVKNEPCQSQDKIPFAEYIVKFKAFEESVKTFLSRQVYPSSEFTKRQQFMHVRQATRSYEDNRLTRSCSVTEFLRNLNISFEEDIAPLISCIVEQEISDKIDLPFVVENEQVSDINGIVIPAIYNNILKPKNPPEIFGRNEGPYILDNLKNNPEFHEYALKKIAEIDTKNIYDIEDYTFMACCHWTEREHYHFKILQLRENFDWISEEAKDACIERMKNLGLTGSIDFEKRVFEELSSYDDKEPCELVGFIDCYDQEEETVYEFKCVAELTNQHKIQLIVYMYLIFRDDKDDEDVVQGKLFNILTNELISIRVIMTNLKQIMHYLFNLKITGKTIEYSDDQFVESFSY